MEYLTSRTTTIILVGIIIIIFIFWYQSRQFFQNRLNLELINQLLLIKKIRVLEEIVKKELQKINKETTDENIISFLKDNKKLLSEEYQKTDNVKEINFDEIIERLIYKKTNKES